ncbi:nucleic acid-binding, OB-fold-like protein [Actinidia rufa]|uniref:Nucleic acid-binding, OB-fold-like protein n=1 Tax=Actinidia rufa TaxID=165716 RepID=A0A7J0FHE6_9ERIC|nr:nucleic acid-binding, OB-fold-like protein [Actinidia rufa]
MAFSGTLQKCKACDKVVHFIEMLTADGVPYHKTCFKCSHCNGLLAMSSYSSMEGVLYCKPHFEQLFKETGSYTKKLQSYSDSQQALSIFLRYPREMCSMSQNCVPTGKGDGGGKILPQVVLQMCARTLQADPLVLRCPRRVRLLQATLCPALQREGQLHPPHQDRFPSSDDHKLDQWDLLELKFGQLIGEDPKLTIAKIRGRKLNPDASYLEIEKLFYEKGGKSRDIEEVPFDVSEEGKSSKSMNGLNLVRPVPKKGAKFEVDTRPLETLVKKPSLPVRKPIDSNRGSLPNVNLRKAAALNENDTGLQNSLELRVKPNLSLKVETEVKKPSRLVRKAVDSNKSSLPNVILRKPTVFSEDDMELQDSSKLRIKPNLSLKMGNKNMNDKFSDITLLKKPEPMSGNSSLDKKQEPSADAKAKVGDDVEESSQRTASGHTPTMISKVNRLEGVNLSAEKTTTAQSNYAESVETGNASLSSDSGLEDYSITGLQPLEQSETEKTGASEENLVDSHIKFSTEAALQGKPKKENEDNDWKRVEDLVKAEEREEVELISASIRGFIVSFGSLIGFLPYRNLASRWKFLAFESWLRRKGLDPFKYKPNLGIIGNYETENNTSLDSNLDQEIDQKIDVDISPDMELEDLLRFYGQEKLQFLSFYVGQKIKVNVVLADRKSRKLIFSMKAKEKEEIVEKKRNLMAKLSIGDVVKCCINKITYFGIFVEVEGVPALIHQTEVSWDATLDPAVYYKVGQIVEAKVQQLDFSLDRIFLSLKGITPDPLIGALEAVIGDHDSLDGRFEAAEADTERESKLSVPASNIISTVCSRLDSLPHIHILLQRHLLTPQSEPPSSQSPIPLSPIAFQNLLSTWAEMESLIKELQQFEGIQSVSKGRFFLSPGLAPTFQVYMASMFENEYKLLARSGNKVQELLIVNLTRTSITVACPCDPRVLYSVACYGLNI